MERRRAVIHSPVGQRSSAVTATASRSGGRNRSLAATSEAEREAEEEFAPAESFIAMGASCLVILKGGGEFGRGVPTGLHPEVQVDCNET